MHRGRPSVRAHPNFFNNTIQHRAIVLVFLVVFVLFQINPVVPLVAHATSSTYAVAIVDYAFQPLHINITTGTTVTWTYSSSGQTIHSVTSDPGTNQTQGGTALLNSGDLNPGQSFSYTFDLPGYYPYQCAVHPTIPAMNGWVKVTGNPVSLPPLQNGSPTSVLLIEIIVAVIAAIVLVALLFTRRKRSEINKVAGAHLNSIGGMKVQQLFIRQFSRPAL